MGEISYIGQQIRYYRENPPEWMNTDLVTQEDLSEATGIPRTMISAVESGRRNEMRVGNLIKIANFFGISLDQLARPKSKKGMVLALV